MTGRYAAFVLMVVAVLCPGWARADLTALVPGGHAVSLARPAVPAGMAMRPMATASGPLASSPGEICRQAMAAAGRAVSAPDHLMSAIGRVESGRRGPDGKINPWPWSINVEGVDHIYDTKDQAIAAVRAFQAAGVRSIDVGCMQVNLLHHPTAFASLEQAFDPVANARYAATFLGQLRAQTGSWEKATAWYHSATPELGDPYQKKVVSVLAEEAQHDLQSLGPNAGGRLGMMSQLSSAVGRARGGMPLETRSPVGRVLPLAGATGRTLDSYRTMPVRTAPMRLASGGS